MPIIRFHISASSPLRPRLLGDVEDHTAIHAMPVPPLLSPELRRVVLRLDGDETVVTTQSPAARVPLDAAADVAREECFRADDPERRPLEQAQPSDAAGHVRDDRAPVHRVDDEVAAVVEKVRRLEIRAPAAELEFLLD